MNAVPSRSSSLAPKGKVRFLHPDKLPGVEVLDVRQSTHLMSFCTSGFGIAYTQESHSTVRFGRNRMSVENRNVFAWEPGTMFEVLRIAHPETVKVLFLPPSLVRQILEELELNTQEFPTIAADINDPNLSEVLRAFFERLERKNATHLEIESRFLQVFRYLSDVILARSPSSDKSSPRIQSRAVKMALALLDERCHEKVTMGDLAKETGLSRFHLLRLFSREVGVPPHAYQLHRRIDKAKSLLKDGVAPAHVAAELGFYDQSHFIKCFKSQLGLTPQEYSGG